MRIAMPWIVVANDPDWKEHRIPCNEASEVADQFVQQRRLGRTVRIEEDSGKEVAASEFGVKD
jgi:hypothetical protein